jgi:hypothetical protein
VLPSRYAAFVSTTFAEDGSNARPLFKLDFGPFMEAKGYNGQVRIDGDWLIIERKAGWVIRRAISGSRSARSLLCK